MLKSEYEVREEEQGWKELARGGKVENHKAVVTTLQLLTVPHLYI